MVNENFIRFITEFWQPLSLHLAIQPHSRLHCETSHQLKQQLLDDLKSSKVQFEDTSWLTQYPWIKQDKDILLEAVKQNGINIMEMPEWARDDQDIALAAIQKTPISFIYASPRLRNDEYLVMKILMYTTTLLYGYLSTTLQDNEKIKWLYQNRNDIPIEHRDFVFDVFCQYPHAFISPDINLITLISELPNRYAIFASHVVNKYRVKEIEDININLY